MALLYDLVLISHTHVRLTVGMLHAVTGMDQIKSDFETIALAFKDVLTATSKRRLRVNWDGIRRASRDLQLVAVGLR